MKHFNAKIEINNIDNLPYTINVPVSAPSANHAKGLACYTAQMNNPGKRVRCVDIYETTGLDTTCPLYV